MIAMVVDQLQARRFSHSSIVEIVGDHRTGESSVDSMVNLVKFVAREAVSPL